MDLRRWRIFQYLDPGFIMDVHLANLACYDSSITTGQRDPPQVGIVQMNNGDVYSIASDTASAEWCGVPLDSDQELLPWVPMKIKPLCGKEIQEISSGREHVLVLTKAGEVYSWGNCDSELFRFKNNNRSGASLVAGALAGRQVIQIACGQSHSLALTVDGEVYSWGGNDFGQLGSGRLHGETTPVRINVASGFGNARVKFIACAGWVSFAIDGRGRVWSWGDDEGPLGYHQENFQTAPALVSSLKHIKTITTGDEHVMAMDVHNGLYFWGAHTNTRNRVLEPKMISMPGGGKIQNARCVRGCSMSAIQTIDGEVFTWGYVNGQSIPEPKKTGFRSLEEAFASLDEPVMMKTLKPTWYSLSQVANKLKMFFDDSSTADVQFVVDGKSLHAHKMFLMLRSDHFRRMFDNEWKENQSGAVDIKGFSYEGFRTFLRYLYTDRIEPPLVSTANAIELFQLADYYGEKDLSGRCGQQIRLLMTLENVSRVYEVAVKHSSESLRSIAIDFMVPRFNDVVQSEGYRTMCSDLKDRLTQELAKDEVFVGLKRRKLN